jgi:hypothetical protein
MRYRPASTPVELSKDLGEFVELVGENVLLRSLWRLGRGLRNKGYVTALDDIRFSLELQLLNLMLCRDKNSGQITSIAKGVHEAVDFITGIGQSIPYLSPKAKIKLRGQIIGGIKTNGLRPLQHEFRVAGKLSDLGCDVQFADLEDLGAHDLMATKNGIEFEVEAKSTPVYSGRSLLLPDAEKFFDVVRKQFDGPTDCTKIPVLNLKLKNRISIKHETLLRLVAACNEVARTKSNQDIDSETSIQFVGEVPDASYEELSIPTNIDWLKNGVLAYVPVAPPKVIVRLCSEKQDRFAENIAATVSECCKKQLSGTKPSVIWVHIDYIKTPDFHSLSFASQGTSQLDHLASVIFSSPNREQLSQLIFSGGTYLRREGVRSWSHYDIVVYDNPNYQYPQFKLFSSQKVRRRDI